jgi:hypothetical protein
MKLRGISHGPRCEPATSSSVDARLTASTGIQTLTFLMPGRSLTRAWLLGEHVIVIKPHRTTSHERARHSRKTRLKDETPIVLVVLPVAEVLDEEPRIIGAACDLGARARAGEIIFDAGAQQRHVPRAQQTAQAHRTVALKRLDVARRDIHTLPAFTDTIFAGSICFLIARLTSSSVMA